MFSKKILWILPNLLIFAQTQTCTPLPSILSQEILTSLFSTQIWNIFEPLEFHTTSTHIDPFTSEAKIAFLNVTPPTFTIVSPNFYTFGQIQIIIRNNQSFLHLQHAVTVEPIIHTSMEYSIILHEANQYFLGYNCTRFTNETTREFILGGQTQPPEDIFRVKIKRKLTSFGLVTRPIVLPRQLTGNMTIAPPIRIYGSLRNSGWNKFKLANYLLQILGLLVFL